MAETNEPFETLMSNLVTRDIVNLPVGFLRKLYSYKYGDDAHFVGISDRFNVD